MDQASARRALRGALLAAPRYAAVAAAVLALLAATGSRNLAAQASLPTYQERACGAAGEAEPGVAPVAVVLAELHLALALWRAALAVAATAARRLWAQTERHIPAGGAEGARGREMTFPAAPAAPAS